MKELFLIVITSNLHVTYPYLVDTRDLKKRSLTRLKMFSSGFQLLIRITVVETTFKRLVKVVHPLAISCTTHTLVGPLIQKTTCKSLLYWILDRSAEWNLTVFSLFMPLRPQSWQAKQVQLLTLPKLPQVTVTLFVAFERCNQGVMLTGRQGRRGSTPGLFEG